MWNPLNNLTHFSPCLGFSKPENLIDKCEEYGYTACAITDRMSLAGTISFLDKAKKSNVKPIIGATFGEVVALSKNYNGWLNLIQMSSNNNLLNYKEDDSVILLVPQKFTNTETLYELEDLFGKDNIFFKEECGADRPSHYLNKQDKSDYHTVLSVGRGEAELELNTEEKRDYYYNSDFELLSPDIANSFNKQIIYNNEKIVEQCESYPISKGLNLPKFPVPGNMSSYDYLVSLARIGWEKKIRGKITKDLEQTYVDRVKKELEVIQRVGLDGYFLIVQDYVNWAKDQNWLVGDGRGSSGGSLVCHLLNITNVDPIKYGTIFERFYNDGRNTKDRKALPDIDTDFPKFKRHLVIEYIKNKYGHDKVGQIATYHELKGKSAITSVMKIHKVADEKEIKKMTKYLPSKEDISDMLANDNESSIVRWVLNNEPKILSDWVSINDEGKIVGDLAQYFEQAIRLEGTVVGIGKHASGIVIAGEPLSQCCPMINDNEGEKITAFDMSDLEKADFVKFDILGVAVLDKLMGINNLLRFGKINVEE